MRYLLIFLTLLFSLFYGENKLKKGECEITGNDGLGCLLQIHPPKQKDIGKVYVATKDGFYLFFNTYKINYYYQFRFKNGLHYERKQYYEDGSGIKPTLKDKYIKKCDSFSYSMISEWKERSFYYEKAGYTIKGEDDPSRSANGFMVFNKSGKKIFSALGSGSIEDLMTARIVIDGKTPYLLYYHNIDIWRGRDFPFLDFPMDNLNIYRLKDLEKNPMLSE